MGKPDTTLSPRINCLLQTACGCHKWQLMPMDEVYSQHEIHVLLPPQIPAVVDFEAEKPPKLLVPPAQRRFRFSSFERLMGTTIAVYEEVRDEPKR